VTRRAPPTPAGPFDAGHRDRLLAEVPHWRFSVDDYHRMVEAGILFEDERSRVELIDGEIIKMSPIGVPHAKAVNRLNRLLVRAVGDGAVVSVQNPVRLNRFSEPQPDLALLRPEVERLDGPPLPEHVLLLVEVADTTLRLDRRVKLPRYAADGIPEVWIVNLGEQVVERYAEPTVDRYQLAERVPRGRRLSCRLLPVTVAVDDVLGPPSGDL
jgi:Uma2 family endonuclease